MSHERESHAVACESCGKRFETESEKEQHTLNDHAANTKLEQLVTGGSKEIEDQEDISTTYLCTKCNMSFKSKSLLEEHSTK